MVVDWGLKMVDKMALTLVESKVGVKERNLVGEKAERKDTSMVDLLADEMVEYWVGC